MRPICTPDARQMRARLAPFHVKHERTGFASHAIASQRLAPSRREFAGRPRLGVGGRAWRSLRMWRMWRVWSASATPAAPTTLGSVKAAHGVRHGEREWARMVANERARLTEPGAASGEWRD